MKRLPAVLLTQLALLTACASCPGSGPPATRDPAPLPREVAAGAQDVVITSHGARMFGRMFMAGGAGPHPVVVVSRGMPDLLGNLDVAMGLRRAGFDVLSFNDRGCWGSEGVYSLTNALQDLQAAVDFVRAQGADGKLRIDARRVVLLGYSYGGPVALRAAAEDPAIHAVVLLDPTEMRNNVQILRDHPKEVAAWLESQGSVRFESGAAFVQEVTAQAAFWDPQAAVAGMAGKDVLLVYASHANGGEKVQGQTLSELLAGSSHVSDVLLDTDHEFSDQRVALTRHVVDWMTALGDRP